MLVLVARKLVPTYEIDDPVFNASAMDGRLVEIAVWSRKDVKWTRDKAEKIRRSLLRVRIFDCRS